MFRISEGLLWHMLKNRIVLINPVNPEPPPNYFGPPYGLSLIGAILRNYKWSVAAYDFDLEPLSVMLASVPKIIKNNNPQYIGISIQSCNRGPVYELIKTIRNISTSITIILGGPFASIKYELLLKNFSIDYVVIGDGERTLIDLLNCLKNGDDPRKVKGIAFLKDNNLYVTEEREKVINLDEYPFPAFDLFKDFDKKINSIDIENKLRPNFILGRRCTILKNALLLLSSQGCIYSCNFCPMSKVIKNKIRFHSPEYFVDMVEYFYIKYGIKNYIFGDNNFTLMRDRTMDICNGILKKGLKIHWSCMTRADYVDREVLKAMARAGCFEISYGIESGSPKIQKEIGKILDLVKAKEAFVLTKKAGIRSILMLMIGNLCETEKTIRDTAYYVRDIDADNILVKVVKVYPGTKIHDIFEKKGLLREGYYLTSEFEPPSFTIQHSEEELDRFTQMINTRRVFIRITNLCNNNCTFCLLDKKENNKGFEEIKKELILASTRADYIIFVGGEPFLRKDLFQILDYADKLEIHHLYIYSNARIFFYKYLTKKLSKTRSLEKIIIPFFGFMDTHDKVTRVKGAFFQSIEGIKNIKIFSPNLKIQAKIFIQNSNYISLFGLTKFLLNLGVDEFEFVYLNDSIDSIKIKITDLPVMTSAITRLEKIAIFLNEAGKSFYFEGFPFCVLKNIKEKPGEPYYPFDEIITLGKKVINCREKREGKKEKFSFCFKCKEDKLCEGVWREYSQAHGDSEFKPYR